MLALQLSSSSLVDCDSVHVQSTNVAGFKISDNTVLIMDEVDGMSAGDRGGIGALNALIRKTRVSGPSLFCPSSVASTRSFADPDYLHC